MRAIKGEQRGFETHCRRRCWSNGTSIATACAERGFDVALFDAGTPFLQKQVVSRLACYGGIRYLEQGHIKLVREALSSDEWQRVAPNATRVERFFFPIYGDSPIGRITLFGCALISVARWPIFVGKQPPP